MGRHANYPTTVEDCLNVSIKKLKEWNYLTIGKKSGSIKWSRNGIEHSSISIEVKISEVENYIYFDYNSNGEPRKYKVKLVCKISNLGKGKVWYFLCPQTNKLCRKLLLQSGYFFHRTAFKNLMYEQQIESKSFRGMSIVFKACFVPDEVYNERYKKYFKTHYKGKPTKRYLKLEQRINKADSYPSNTLERLMINNSIK